MEQLYTENLAHRTEIPYEICVLHCFCFAWFLGYFLTIWHKAVLKLLFPVSILNKQAMFESC